MTKAELISEIAMTTGYDKATVGVVVESLMGSVKKNLGRGENIYLRGFGTFATKTRKAKIARNITLNTSVPVPEHQIAYFKPATELAAAVRNVKKK
ncbi:MAG: integration host factor subunit beta [Paludibacteraceae bacterium]|nr:integration host factor subunit beta [Paludibacteraceae bacterium]